MGWPADTAEQVHANMVLAAARVIHPSVPLARQAELGGWALFDSGRPDMPFLNAAFPVLGTEPDISRAEAWFEERGSHCLFRLQRDSHKALLDRVTARGYTVSRSEPVLVNDTPAIPSFTSELEIVTVRDELEFEAAARRAGISMNIGQFSVEMGKATALMRAATECWGFLGDRLVAGSIVVTTPPVAGIYAVHCEPEYRRRGFGSAVTWAAVKAGMEDGSRRFFMGATEMAFAMYKRMGFTPVGEYVILGRER
jgi:ribosomal protein S18 acetylase RimI-like enzyme